MLQWIATLVMAYWNRLPVDMGDVMAIAGAGLVLMGLAWWSVPVACIVAGVVLVYLATRRK